MVERIIDGKYRIVLPSETRKVFENGLVYFRYNEKQDRVLLLSSSQVRDIKEDIERRYGEARMSNKVTNDLFREVASQMYCSQLRNDRRVVIPLKIADKAKLGVGKKVNISLEKQVVTLNLVV